MTLAFRVFVYIRVSTEEQAKEGFSISAQKERNTQFYMSQNWDLHDFYIDEGVSAKDTNRPELSRMLKEIEEFRKANPKAGIVVLTYKLDRLTRSILDLFQLLKTFEELNVGFKSTTEVFDTTTAMGRLFIAITGAMAQWERENLGERVKMGMDQKVRQGIYPGGTVPYGYRLIEGVLLHHEEEAQTIRYIFEQYASGRSLEDLAILLDKSGTPTKTGAPWSGRSLSYIIKNPIYVGRLRRNFKTNTEEYFEVETDYEPILSNELFERVQQRVFQQKKFHPRSASSPYVFSGKLKCPVCGNTLRGHDTTSPSRPPGDYVYYRCNKKTNIDSRCSFTGVKASLVEKKFLEYIRAITANNAAMEVAATEEKNQTSVDNSAQISKLRSEIEKTKGNKAKWQRAFADDVITLEDLRERTAEDNAKIEWLLGQIKALEPHVEEERLSLMDMFQILIDVEANWNEATLEEKKEAVAILVDHIVVQKAGKGRAATIGLEVKFN